MNPTSQPTNCYKNLSEERWAEIKSKATPQQFETLQGLFATTWSPEELAHVTPVTAEEIEPFIEFLENPQGTYIYLLVNRNNFWKAPLPVDLVIWR